MPITHGDLNLSIEEVFHETDLIYEPVNEQNPNRNYDLAGSYKTFSKWEMDFGAEDEIQQYIQKHNLEDSINDYSYNKAKRDYKWTTFYKNLALHDTNKFVSIQMKKNFMAPVLRKQWLMGMGDKNINRRVEVVVPGIACNQTMGKDKRTMIIPDSYEKEKFLRK